ncbi:unnamed protein product [Amoebophrya sp. A120]|nr:unnamed protein product [Amoebophrya sp. A120]|eukprot:GSA120T00025854001.1
MLNNISLQCRPGTYSYSISTTLILQFNVQSTKLSCQIKLEYTNTPKKLRFSSRGRIQFIIGCCKIKH